MCLAFALVLVAATARAQDKPRPLLIARELSPADAQALARETQPRGIEVAAPLPAGEPASEALLAPIRQLYANMEFGKAARTLLGAEEALIAGRLPSPGLQRAVAEAELWMGALLWLGKDAAGAADHWELAHRLAPSARPDRLFPPQVHQAFAKAAPEPRPVPIALKLAPAGARLWLDGKRAGERVTASPGLHWIVVERADRRPVARVMRVTEAAPEIAVNLGDAAQPADAVRQAAARAADGALGSDEGVALSATLGRSLWIVGGHGADRFDAGDVAQATRHVDFDGDAVGAICAVEPACIALPAPRKPLYQRAVLWVPIAVGVALVVGAGVLGGTLANNSSDYVVRVR